MDNINNSMLNFALEKGIIDKTYIQEQCEIMHRKELLEKHPYKIWEGKDKKWRTYLPDKIKGRVLKKRTTKEALENDIIEYWRQEIENPTVGDIFSEWLERRKSDIRPSTYDRYKRQYDECFQSFGNRRIKTVTEFDIEEFMLGQLHAKHMTAKAYANLRTIVYGIFKFAKKQGYVSYRIVDVVQDFDLSKNCFKETRKSDNEQVFMDDEFPVIMNYLQDHLDVVNIGLIIMFVSGLRVGELSALMVEDIDNCVIHVRRTEICYEIDGKRVYTIGDPKTASGYRDVLIPQKYKSILDKAMSSSVNGYLLEQNGERIPTYKYRNRLRYLCKKLNLVNKSPHKIRKTYASIMLDNNVAESFVISQMGHTNIKTTMTHYYCNRNNDESKQQIVDDLSVF